MPCSTSSGMACDARACILLISARRVLTGMDEALLVPSVIWRPPAAALNTSGRDVDSAATLNVPALSPKLGDAKKQLYEDCSPMLRTLVERYRAKHQSSH